MAECAAGARAMQSGKTQAALARYAAGVALAPDDAAIAALHGGALRSAGRLQDAQRELIRAIALDRTRADSYAQLAHTYTLVGDHAQSAEAFLAAAALAPNDAGAWRNLAEAMRTAGRIADGLDAARHAHTLAPHDPTVANTLAILLHRSARLEDALQVCTRAREHTPSDLLLTLTHAMLLLTHERWPEGWALHERRLELPALTQRDTPPASPRWTGAPLHAAHVLVRAEQGLGDQVQFVRWACTLKAAGAGMVTVQAAPTLCRLLATAPHIDAVVPTNTPLPAHDLHADIMSLPHLLQTGADMLGAMVPYLHAPGVAPQAISTRLGARTGTRRIGLAWAGAPTHSDDRTRSMSLTDLAPLLARHDVEWVVLQQGPARAQLDTLDPAVRDTLCDVAPDCTDMGDTAHVIATCDAVLCVDTAVAHVAGALGVPAWVMVAHPAEWRWGHARTDSPFYPAARIFRQTRSHDWHDVVQAVNRAIDTWPAPGTRT